MDCYTILKSIIISRFGVTLKYKNESSSQNGVLFAKRTTLKCEKDLFFMKRIPCGEMDYMYYYSEQVFFFFFVNIFFFFCPATLAKG